MHGDHGLAAGIQNGLGIYYLLVVLLDLGFAAYWYYRRRDGRQAVIWSAVAAVFLVHALAYFLRLGWQLPQGFADWTTNVAGMFNG
ncbi:MAG: hypothetical protein ACJ76J_30230, partial [Thermoanaerobaculia bacterium]